MDIRQLPGISLQFDWLSTSRDIPVVHFLPVEKKQDGGRQKHYELENSKLFTFYCIKRDKNRMKTLPAIVYSLANKF
jgi:hypothetical protein